MTSDAVYHTKRNVPSALSNRKKPTLHLHVNSWSWQLCISKGMQSEDGIGVYSKPLCVATWTKKASMSGQIASYVFVRNSKALAICFENGALGPRRTDSCPSYQLKSTAVVPRDATRRWKRNLLAIALHDHFRTCQKAGKRSRLVACFVLKVLRSQIWVVAFEQEESIEQFRFGVGK